jgi:cytochrome c oxidase subunit IV
MMNETLCVIDWDKLVRVFAALLTPLIALVTMASVPPTTTTQSMQWLRASESGRLSFPSL